MLLLKGCSAPSPPARMGHWDSMESEGKEFSHPISRHIQSEYERNDLARVVLIHLNINIDKNGLIFFLYVKFFF